MHSEPNDLRGAGSENHLVSADTVERGESIYERLPLGAGIVGHFFHRLQDRGTCARWYAEWVGVVVQPQRRVLTRLSRRKPPRPSVGGEGSARQGRQPH